jgi:hypothetical protein
MPIINKTGLNLSLLGYTSKREYFGGNAIVFREVETYSYEYLPLNLNNLGSGLSPSIISEISGQFTGFNNDVSIKTLDVPAAYETPQDQIRTSKYNISVEVRKAIGSGDSNYYTGLNYVTLVGAGAINGFSENFSFDNAEDSKKFSHSVNFELRTGDINFAKSIASGLFRLSSPSNLGINVLSGYLGVYDDANSQNYYSETYDTLKNSYSFQKTKNLFKLSGLNYTYDINTKYEYNNGIINVNDEVKVKGKASYEQAVIGMESLVGNAWTRSSGIYSSYRNFSNLAVSGSLFPTALKTVKKFNLQSLTAECSTMFTDDPQYKGQSKQEQSISLSKDINGIVNIKNQYNFNILSQVTGDMDSLYLNYVSGQTASSDDDMAAYYADNLYSGNLVAVSTSVKTPRRKRGFSVEYEYSDDPRYEQTLTTFNNLPVAFKRVEEKFSDATPKDNITEYKVINKPQTLINYAYQQSPGTKTVTLSAIRYRPLSNQMTNFSLPVNEVNSLYRKALDILTRSFTNINGLNYYLSNLSFSISHDNKLELTASINYTNKKYV